MMIRFIDAKQLPPDPLARSSWTARIARLANGTTERFGPYKNNNTAQVMYYIMRKRYPLMRFRLDGVYVEVSMPEIR